MNATPCKAHEQCHASPVHVGESAAMCIQCKWAQDNGGIYNYWNPRVKGTKNPAEEEAKKRKKAEKLAAKKRAQAAKDPNRQYYSKRAASAEQRTNRLLARQGVSIRATRNSGRTRKDADHLVQIESPVAREKLTLDTKLQSSRLNPVVFLSELDKVRADAGRAGSTAGALLVRNQCGRGVVVFAEEDLDRLFS